jgi:S-adenosylhomocysteine hydrolase
MRCPECNGRGETFYFVETERDEHSVTIEQRKGVCRTCNGSGEKTTTNADRIRAMSDEELAWFMADRNVNESTVLLLNKDHGLTATQIAAMRHNIYCALMQWLQQPAEGE